MPSTIRCGLALLLVSLAACGGDPGPANPIDARTPRDTAVDTPIPIDGPTLCNTEFQNCSNGEKCTLTGGRPQCVPIDGRRQLGETCTRGGPSVDDCDSLLVCHLGTCKLLCTRAGAQCPNSGHCLQYQTFNDGTCADPCTPFDSANTCAPGSTCEVGFTISGVGPGYRCRPIGTVIDGRACNPEGAPFCLEDSTCGTIEGSFCGALCSDSHPCETGTCTRYPGDPTLGACGE